MGGTGFQYVYLMNGTCLDVCFLVCAPFYIEMCQACVISLPVALSDADADPDPATKF
jgi:hypothetical protein